MDLTRGGQEAGAMEKEILANIATASTQDVGRVLDVRDYAAGDGSDQTSQIISFFDAAQDGDTLLFTSGHYKVVKSGWFYTFLGRKVNIVGSPGAVLEVSDQGIRVDSSDYVHVDGLNLRRTSQAPWGHAKTGLHVRESNNVMIENCDIAKFTDAVWLRGPKDGGFTRNNVVRNNVFHELGEEGVVMEVNLEYILVSGNDISRHLGDGILLKGTRHALITNNFVHSAVQKTDPDFITYSGGSTSSVLPSAGGGIACNSETGENGAKAVYVNGNVVRDVGYGISLTGFYGAWISDNHVQNISKSAGISVAFLSSIYNPDNVPNHLFVISSNIVESITNSGMTTAIEAISIQGTAGMDTGVIANNIVVPRGNHWGIQAKGNIIVQNNHISEAGISLNLSDGVVASGNIVRPAHTSAPSDRSVHLGSYVVFTSNAVEGSGTTIKISGKNNVITGNMLKYTGKWWAVSFEGIAQTDGGNIFKDNMLESPATADGRVLYDKITPTKAKNIVIDTIKDAQGALHQAYQGIALRSPDWKYWAISVDNTGTVMASPIVL